MKKPQYEVGMLVEHPNRPIWGPGKVVYVDSMRVHVFFRDDLERKAKQILYAVVPLKVAESQTDPVLDQLPAPTEELGSYRLPANYKKGVVRDVPSDKPKKSRSSKKAATTVTTG